MKLRLFMKQDLQVVESFIKKDEEVRLGLISESGKKVMLICKNDDLHKWIDIDKLGDMVYSDYVEDNL